MITGFDGQNEEHILDGDEMAAYEDLAAAARAVVANWEEGDLAAAVRDLDAALKILDAPEPDDPDDYEDKPEPAPVTISKSDILKAAGAVELPIPNPELVTWDGVPVARGNMPSYPGNLRTLPDGRRWNGLAYVHDAPVEGCTCGSCAHWFKRPPNA